MIKLENKNRLLISYGFEPKVMLPELLKEANFLSELPSSGLIVIKPNLVLAKNSSSGATTDPQVVASIISFLKINGFHDIAIMESSWLGDCTDRAFRICGYEEISKTLNVPLVNLKKDQTKKVASGSFTFNICKKVLDSAYLINVPVLKAHCQTRLTCALKNLKGCIPDSEKRRFHDFGLHEPIARLNSAIKSRLIVVDAIIGDLTFEEGGTPVQ
ncbi:DUF362 domain-containing protein, partial [bacterium]|nr:DUF362 domain-containing protein [bacterium]